MLRNLYILVAAMVFLLQPIAVVMAADSSPAAVSSNATTSAGSVSVSARKVLVLLMFDQNCKTWCEQVKPLISELEQEYGSQVQFVQMDTSESSLQESKKVAKELGVMSFLAAFGAWVPHVGVFSSASGKMKVIQDLQGAKDKSAYIAAIQKALQANK